MHKRLARFGLVLVAVIGLAPSAALAKPFVRVVVAPPVVVVAPPRVVLRPACPGPNFVWVESHWRGDAYGRRVFVGGHWAPRPRPVVVRSVRPPGPNRVIVRRY